MGRFPEHKCFRDGCENITTNRKYCSRSCRSKDRRLSEESRSKIGESKLGKERSDETKSKISKSLKGRKSPFYGKSHTEDSRCKMSESKLGKKHSDDTKRKMSESHKGKLVTDHTKRKISESIRKSYNEELKTKLTCEYHIVASKYYKYECCGCGKAEGKLSVHHIDGNHNNNSPDNLAWLCISCHNKIHPNRLRGNSSIDEEFTKIILENRNLLEGDE